MVSVAAMKKIINLNYFDINKNLFFSTLSILEMSQSEYCNLHLTKNKKIELVVKISFRILRC